MHTNLSISVLGGFVNPHTSAQSPGRPPGLHNGEAPSGKGKYSRRLPPSGAVEVTSNHVQLLFVYQGTDRSKHVFGDTAFLGISVVTVQRHHREVPTTFRCAGFLRKFSRETTAWKTQLGHLQC